MNTCIICGHIERFFYARLTSFAVTCTRDCNEKWEEKPSEVKSDELNELRKKLGKKYDC